MSSRAPRTSAPSATSANSATQTPAGTPVSQASWSASELTGAAAGRSPGGARAAGAPPGAASAPAPRPAAPRRTAGTRPPRRRTPPRSAGPASQHDRDERPAGHQHRQHAVPVAHHDQRHREQQQEQRQQQGDPVGAEQRRGARPEQRRCQVPGEGGDHDAGTAAPARGTPSRPRCPACSRIPSSRRPDSSEAAAWPPSCAMVIAIRVSRHSRGLATISSATAALTATTHPAARSAPRSADPRTPPRAKGMRV